jgi:hypothetical protein
VCYDEIATAKGEAAMPMQVVNSAQLMCSFGTTPSSLVVLPTNREQVEHQFAANIMDYIPMVNIMPFGMCMSIANPQVAAATAAALGVLTPQPCIPATATPWTPGAPTVLLANQPSLDNISTCMCTWLGVISVTNPGQTSTQIP